MAETRIRDIGATPDGDRMWRRLLALEDNRMILDDRAAAELVRQATRELRDQIEELRERVSVLEGDAPGGDPRPPAAWALRISPN